MTPLDRSRGRSGFTLLELLAVLAIIIILSALVVPSLIGISGSYYLNRASSMVNDELNFARQTALTRNSDVEVRFYKVGTVSNPTDLQFRAFRAILSSTGESLDKISYLPDQIIISSNIAYSTIFDYTNTGRGGLTQGTETLTGKGPTTYISFLFRATGGTGLTASSTALNIWDLALIPEKAPVVGTTGLPSNYVSLQIDPVEGQIRVYRP